jgi:hypothetical protein
LRRPLYWVLEIILSVTAASLAFPVFSKRWYVFVIATLCFAIVLHALKLLPQPKKQSED